MAVNKVVLGEDTLIDLTADTVSADKLSKGSIFIKLCFSCHCSRTPL